VSDGLALVAEPELRRLHAAALALIEVGDGLEPRLAGAVADTLARPGSLWRMQLAWIVGRAEGLGPEPALDLAAGVEAFHVASLLFDDLPAMDDAATRRGAPCVHHVHGEAAAILAGLAFVHRGYARVWRALDEASAAVRRAARERVEECLGLAGILDGQARDLAPVPADPGADAAAARAAGKTVPLLRLALTLPAIVAGAPAARERALDRLASAWGLAYQILDDLGDLAGSDADLATGRANFAATVGFAAALARLDLELSRAELAAAEITRERPGLADPFRRLTARFVTARGRLAPPVRRVAGG
jgi:geranylgeranyl pyrophosphate synthase